jgi:hypothetical protein
MADTYKEVKTFEFANAVVRVHIPDITPEERNRRMKAIYTAAGALLGRGTK